MMVLADVKNDKSVNLIINKEYCLEIKTKVAQINEINKIIRRTKLLLLHLQHSIVADFYQNKCTSPNKYVCNGSSSGKSERFNQIVLNPAIKNVRLVNNKDSNPMTMNDSEDENSKYNSKESITLDQHNVPNGNDYSENLKLSCKENVKLKRSVPGRGSNQTKHLIVVGNTSKYIGMEDPSDSTTHKWLIYIISKSKIPIEKIVYKARFFLHSSYNPNDIIDVE